MTRVPRWHRQSGAVAIEKVIIGGLFLAFVFGIVIASFYSHRRTVGNQVLVRTLQWIQRDRVLQVRLAGATEDPTTSPFGGTYLDQVRDARDEIENQVLSQLNSVGATSYANKFIEWQNIDIGPGGVEVVDPKFRKIYYLRPGDRARATVNGQTVTIFNRNLPERRTYTLPTSAEMQSDMAFIKRQYADQIGGVLRDATLGQVSLDSSALMDAMPVVDPPPGTAGMGGFAGVAGSGMAGIGGTAGVGGTTGSGMAGTGVAGTGTAGAGTAGTGFAGTAGAGAAGTGTAGAGTAGTGTAGTGTAGAGTAGTGTAGTGTAGAGTAGTGSAGTGSSGVTGGMGAAGAGTAGTGAAGTGTAGTGTAGTGSAGAGSAGAGAAGTSGTSGSAGTAGSAGCVPVEGFNCPCGGQVCVPGNPATYPPTTPPPPVGHPPCASYCPPGFNNDGTKTCSQCAPCPELCGQICCTVTFERIFACYHPDTPIVMGDGKTTKRAAEIVSGDKVWSPLARRAYTVGRVYEGPEKFPLVQLVAGSRKLIVNRDHVILTERGLVKVHQLTILDRLAVEDGSWADIDSISQLPHEGKPPFVHNFEVDGGQHSRDRLVVSGGFISGDRVIQDQLLMEPNPVCVNSSER